MIVLDTNVVSQGLRPDGDATVREWMREASGRERALAATVVAELMAGAAAMAAGRRRDRLNVKIESLLVEFPVLPFDMTAARHYAEIVADRRRAGLPISTFDAQIAAIARANGAAIATRDDGGFEGCGIEVINPWSHRP